MLLMTLTYAFKESFTYERRSEPGHAAARADPEARPRQLPRPRAADDRGAALRSASPPASSRATSTCRAATAPRYRGGGSTHAWCAGLPAGRRLGRVRPHQRHRRQPRPDPRGRGARSEPGHPAVGLLFRCRRRFPGHDGGGEGALARAAGAIPRQSAPSAQERGAAARLATSEPAVHGIDLA